MAVKSDPDAPMTLGVAAAARSQRIVLASGMIRSSPTPPRWLLGTAPKRPCSIGANGWCVLSAAAGRSIWC